MYCYIPVTACVSVCDGGRVEGLVDVVLMACGQDHCVVVCASGNVFSWGEDEDGQLGLPLNQLCNRDRPRQVSAYG